MTDAGYDTWMHEALAEVARTTRRGSPKPTPWGVDSTLHLSKTGERG